MNRLHVIQGFKEKAIRWADDLITLHNDQKGKNEGLSPNLLSPYMLNTYKAIVQVLLCENPFASSTLIGVSHIFFLIFQDTKAGRRHAFAKGFLGMFSERDFLRV